MSLVNTIVGAFVTFLFASVAGNWLIQAWQHRNWLNQQSFLGKEREYLALKELFEELSSLAGRRITRMRRLIDIVRRPDDDLVKQRLEDYDKAQTEWNDRLNTFFARLKLYLDGYGMVQRLEGDIQRRFLEIGHQIELIVRERLHGSTPQTLTLNQIAGRLYSLVGIIDNFNRDMLRLVENVKKETYFGVEFRLSPETLEKFSTFDLIKALFKPRIETHRVIRTSADLGEPKRWGD